MHSIKEIIKGIIKAILITFLFTAEAAADEKINNHYSEDKPHVCFGLGAHFGLYRGGLQTRLLFNDMIGVNLKGYGDWALSAGGGVLELRFKAPIKSNLKPYVLVGGGYHIEDIDTTFNERPYHTRLGMGTLRAAVGGEWRFGGFQNHGLSLEAGYFRGSAEYKTSGTVIGNSTIQNTVREFTLEPVTAQLLYNYYFCKPKDRDGDGMIDSEDACPDDPEDFDGFKDEDGCPEYDNDNDGLADTVDNCPNNPEDIDGFEDIDGCPDYDNDKDGLADTVDNCPNSPEDIDEFEDADGCPDYDNDKDTIPDTTDNCPNDPETYNGFEDIDGCPDELPAAPEIERGAITLTGVTFESGSSVLKPESFDILDKVGASLNEWGEIRIEIQGHTDNTGSAELNRRLSDNRAKSVRRYLIEYGIEESRLRAIGHGEDIAIADNNTIEGRAINRRVELHRID